MQNSLSNTPAILLAGGLIAAIVANTGWDLRRLVSGRNVVLAGIGSWFALEAVTLPAALAAFTQEEYTAGVLAVAASAASFLLGYHCTRNGHLFRRLGGMVRRLDDHDLLWRVVLAGAVVGFVPVLYFGTTDLMALLDGIVGMRKSWGGALARGRYGDARAAFLMLEMFATGVGPFAAILFLDRRTTWGRRIVCVTIIVWPILRAYGSGTRSSMITSVVPVLGICYLMVPPATQRRLLATLLLLAPLSYQLMAALVISRTHGEFSWEARKEAEYVGNEMFRELLFIQSKVPSDADYQYGYSYYVQLVNPIPRFLWPGKPTLDTGLLMASLYGEVDRATGEAHLTVSPGLIGEMYLNFGWLGVIGLSALGGWLVRNWDRIAELHRASLVTMIYYFAGLATLFIMGRSFTMGMFYGLLSFAVLAWVVSKTARSHEEGA